MKKFELGYSIRDCGDGSVAVGFFPNRELAEEDEKQRQEDGSTCWGETCASAVTLTVIEGTIYLCTYEYRRDEQGYKRVDILTPLDEVGNV